MRLFLEDAMGTVRCERCGKDMPESQVKHGDCQQCSLCEDCVAAYIGADCKDCKKREGA
ncbi:MAG: hypothetical protein LBG87_00155 [Spirochaetaceae bacterium]|nr:hypothetical protein [Spirochaetaceae bacterium]